MEYSPLLVLLIVDALSVISPGPKILLVAQSAVEYGRSQALHVVLGISFGSLIWSCAAMAGLSLLIERISFLSITINLIGIAYILYLGWQVFNSSSPSFNPKDGRYKKDSDGFAQGLFMSILNAESIVYFTSIFILFIPENASTLERITGILIPVGNALVLFGAAALCFSISAIRNKYLSLAKPINKVCGAIVIAFGVQLVFNLFASTQE